MLATSPELVRYFYLPYAWHFRRRGWRVDVATGGAAREVAFRGAFDHVYDLPLSRSTLDVHNYTRGLRAISQMLATGPDIVHVHSPIAAFLTRLAARHRPAAGRPAVVYTAHGFHFHRDGGRMTNLAFRTAERVAGRWTDRLIVINDEDEAAALTYRIVPRRRLVRMPGVGIDTEHYRRGAVPDAEVARARQAAGVPANVPLFVVVAELHPRKRQDDVIAALAAMTRQDAHLVLVGEGISRPGLERLVARLGIGERVHFLGFVEDVRPMVLGATGVVVASTREGLARSVMEALALEAPVIASTARGNTELVGGGCGILARTGDVAGLAAAMDHLIDDPADARAMAVRGRARVVARYRLDDVIHLHECLYAAMLAERSGDRSG